MDSTDLIDIVPMPTTVSNSSKPARPKSAVRRKTIDRDLDMIEGLDFTKDEFEVDDNEETEVPFEIHELGDSKFILIKLQILTKFREINFFALKLISRNNLFFR